MISWFRYVPHPLLAERIAEGWEPVTDLGPIHGFWSVLCIWRGEGEPT
jgi:hypothetical protein